MRNGADGVHDAEFALHCIGDVRLYLGGVDCTPKSRKGRALLAILAAERRPLTRVRIIDLLWSDRQEEQARASLRTLLADLRDQFGEDFDNLLLADRERIALVDSVRTDLTDASLVRPAGELFEGLDHLDPELDDWLRAEREKWGNGARTPPIFVASEASAPQQPAVRRFAGLFGLVMLLLVGALAMWFGPSFGQSAVQPRVAEARTLLLRNSPAAADAARRMLIGVVQQHPNDADALATLAEATMAISDHPGIGGSLPHATAKREARSYALRAIKLQPKEASAWAALGFSYFATAEAVKPLEKAVELDPNNAKYRWQLARALEYENRYDEAYLHVRRAMQLDPLGPEPMVGLFRVATQLERTAEMKAELLAYNRRRPTAGDLAWVNGYYAYALSDDPACIKFLEPMARKGDLRAFYTLASCLTDLGEKRRAAELSAGRPSLLADILRDDAIAVARRAKSMGREFWLRNFESLAAADLLMRAGKADALLRSFDASYDSIAEFKREGGRVSREPFSILLAMQTAGRKHEARQLRELTMSQVAGYRDGMAGGTWAAFTKAAVALADGERDRSVALLEQCYPDCMVADFDMDISQTAFFGQLRGHARFDRLVQRYRQDINLKRKEAGLPALPV